MTESFILNNNKKFWILSTIFTILLISPVVFFGINDLEEYQLGYFTLGTYFNFPSLYFNGYIDIYGPGVKLPIGNFPYLHPTNVFYNNTQLHYFFYIITNLYIQLFFLKKLVNLIFKEENWIVLLIIFSIPNFNYIYSDDWSGAFFVYTAFFPIFYYWLKYLIKKNHIIFFKFILCISFAFINGHIGNHFMQYLFLILLTLLNRNFFYLKKKYFYIGILLLILITFESFYYTFSEYLQFNQEASIATQSNYSLSDYIKAILLPIKFSEWSLNRNPFYGIIFFIILFCFPFNLKKTKQIYYLDILFVIFFIFSITSFSKYFYFISAIWQFRDILNALSLILLIHYSKQITSINLLKINKLLISFHILILILFWVKNVSILDFDRTNFITYSNKQKLSIVDKLKYDKLNEFKKTYLSPEFNKVIRNGLKKNGIFSVTDLIKLKIYPFNGWFKNFSVDDFYKANTKMHGKILSSYDEINNEIFLNSFLINKIIFFESEKSKIKIPYSIEKKIKIKNEVIYVANLKNVGIPIKLISSKKLYNSCVNSNLINCFTNNKNFQINKNVSIKRIDVNNYVFQNNNNYSIKFIFPFSAIKNWKHNFSLVEIEKFKRIGIVEMQAGESVNAKYHGNIRLYLKIVSLLSFLSIMIYVIFFNYKTK